MHENTFQITKISNIKHITNKKPERRRSQENKNKITRSYTGQQMVAKSSNNKPVEKQREHIAK